MKLFFAGMLMLVVEPFLRIPEAILRMIFLSDHYGSFWNALKSDWFFSEGWFAYIKTPLGMGYTIFLGAWTLIAVALIAAAFLRLRREGKRLSSENTVGVQDEDST